MKSPHEQITHSPETTEPSVPVLMPDFIAAIKKLRAHNRARALGAFGGPSSKKSREAARIRKARKARGGSRKWLLEQSQNN